VQPGGKEILHIWSNKQQPTGIFAAFRNVLDEIFLYRDDQFHHLQTFVKAGERSSSLPASLLDSASLGFMVTYDVTGVFCKD
jgi:hypothetical protein